MMTNQSSNPRREALRSELIDRISSLLPSPGVFEPIPGIRFRSADEPSELAHGASFPCFCVIAQGAKELRVGNRGLRYDPETCLVASDTLPFASRVSEASPERPYLGVVVLLDSLSIGSVIAQSSPVVVPNQRDITSIEVADLETDLLDAVVRLVRTLDPHVNEAAIRPLILHEIIWRLLGSDQGDRVRQIASVGDSNRIRRAIAILRTEFDRPLRIETLAGELGMSVSSLHHRFKEATSMSPLQFQKQLRLQEARRLMLGEQLDASSAGFRVGYEDAAYFNRDYKRFFGEPPGRDIQRLRLASSEAYVAGL